MHKRAQTRTDLNTPIGVWLLLPEYGYETQSKNQSEALLLRTAAAAAAAGDEEGGVAAVDDGRLARPARSADVHSLALSVHSCGRIGCGFGKRENAQDLCGSVHSSDHRNLRRVSGSVLFGSSALKLGAAAVLMRVRKVCCMQVLRQQTA